MAAPFSSANMIYDCFTFFNELELLELRLNELAGVVDKFVLVEATQTHTGQPKPLHFQNNRARFHQFQDKIIHIVVADLPKSKNAWVLERFQRNAIARGLAQCQPDDVVLISDLDEIPRATTVASASKSLPAVDTWAKACAHVFLNSWLVRGLTYPKDLRRHLRRHHPYFYKFKQVPYNYFLNCRFLEPPFTYGTRLLHYRDFSTADEIRYSGYKIVEDGGWHFSFMGGADRVREKLLAYAHQEFNRPEFTDAQAIEVAINRGDSLPGQNWKLQFVPLDDTFPRFLLEHREKFSPLIKPV